MPPPVCFSLSRTRVHVPMSRSRAQNAHSFHGADQPLLRAQGDRQVTQHQDHARISHSAPAVPTGALRVLQPRPGAVHDRAGKPPFQSNYRTLDIAAAILAWTPRIPPHTNVSRYDTIARCPSMSKCSPVVGSRSLPKNGPRDKDIAGGSTTRTPP